MAFYLVTAKLKENKKQELKENLKRSAFLAMEPFGRAISKSLENARIRDDGYIVWEEEDYCSPPLKQERAAVLDNYFVNIDVEAVKKGEGWDKISDLPKLFPELTE